MDRDSIRNAVASAAASVLAFGTLWLHRLKAKNNQIARKYLTGQDYDRENYINSILYRGDQNCVDTIRMRPIAFFSLCDALTRNNLLRSTESMHVREQVMIFLHIIGHNVKSRVIRSAYHRSLETIECCFRTVFVAIRRLYSLVVSVPDELTPYEIRSSPRFYPYFEDCVGALGGFHVRATVPFDDTVGRYRSRKGGLTQNVLVAVTFDLKFSFILAGWEGSAEDSRVLNDALTRPRGFRIPEGKYYLADAGYEIRKGILTPYRDVRYHLKEFDGRRPENAKELFNFRHSSLRAMVDRVSWIMKKRFRVLDDKLRWDYKTQVGLVLVCSVVHNHIMGVDPNDLINQEQYEEPEPDLILSDEEEEEDETEETREWEAKRDEIAETMWSDYVDRI